MDSVKKNGRTIRTYREEINMELAQVYQNEIYQLQSQLQSAYVRIKELNEEVYLLNEEINERLTTSAGSVSYTHLTLPTKRIV